MELTKEYIDHLPDSYHPHIKGKKKILRGPSCECGEARGIEHEHCPTCGKLLCIRYSHDHLDLGTFRLKRG